MADIIPTHKTTDNGAYATTTTTATTKQITLKCLKEK